MFNYFKINIFLNILQYHNLQYKMIEVFKHSDFLIEIYIYILYLFIISIHIYIFKIIIF